MGYEGMVRTRGISLQGMKLTAVRDKIELSKQRHLRIENAYRGET